jgi:TLC domain
MDRDPIYVTAASFFTCLLLNLVLPRNWAHDFRGRAISCVHAILVTVLSVYAWKDPEVWSHLQSNSSVVWSKTPESTVYPVAITLGYMICDSLFGMYYGIIESSMLIHHLVIIVSFGSGFMTGIATTFHALFLINEASTPFLNIYFMRRKEDTFTVVNGLMLWLTYIVFRVLANCVLTYYVLSTSHLDIRASYTIAWGVQICVLLTIDALNVIWFYKLTKRFTREALNIISPKKNDGKTKKLQ